MTESDHWAVGRVARPRGRHDQRCRKAEDDAQECQDRHRCAHRSGSLSRFARSELRGEPRNTTPKALAKRAHRRWGTEGSNPSPSSGESLANLTSLWGLSRSTSAIRLLAIGGDLGVCIHPSDGGPRVRIHLPPAESLSLAGLYLRGSRTPAFRAGVPGCVPGAVGRDPRGPADIAPSRGNISLRLYSSTAFPAMRSRQAVGLKPRGCPQNEIGLPTCSGMLVDLVSSGGSSKAERGPLIMPT